MKKQIKYGITSLILAVTILVAGCKSPEQGAYRTIGTVAQTVDVSMKTYGDAYRAGLVTADEQAKVKAAYEHYQQTMRIARAAVVTAKAAPAEQAAFYTAMQTVEAASADLITLINLTKKP
jgi:hypothetical protein